MNTLLAASIAPGLPPVGESDHEKAVLALVKDITDRGNIAVFRRPVRVGARERVVVKAVRKFEVDSDGDLVGVALRNASTPYICPADTAYTISEVESMEDI